MYSSSLDFNNILYNFQAVSSLHSGLYADKTIKSHLLLLISISSWTSHLLCMTPSLKHCACSGVAVNSHCFECFCWYFACARGLPAREASHCCRHLYLAKWRQVIHSAGVGFPSLIIMGRKESVIFFGLRQFRRSADTCLDVTAPGFPFPVYGGVAGLV